jgi:hypothetical protein
MRPRAGSCALKAVTNAGKSGSAAEEFKGDAPRGWAVEGSNFRAPGRKTRCPSRVRGFKSTVKQMKVHGGFRARSQTESSARACRDTAAAPIDFQIATPNDGAARQSRVDHAVIMLLCRRLPQLDLTGSRSIGEHMVSSLVPMIAHVCEYRTLADARRRS